MSEEIERPSDRFTLNVNGTDTEIFMSSGLRDRLVEIVGAGMSFGEALVDAGMQDQLCVMALVPRNERGRETGKYSINDFEFSIDQGNAFKMWLTEHVYYFFIDMAQSSGSPRMSQLLLKLMGSYVGPLTSQDPKLSAGPLDVASATSK